MNSHARLFATTFACAALLTWMAGCEDSASRQRSAVQAQIQQASQKLQKALVAGSEDDASAKALNGVVADISRIDGGEPGQQAAKGVIAATALCELANLKLDAAEAIESQHRDVRSGLDARITAAMRLAESADALESIDAATERQNLQRELDVAKAAVAQLRAKIEQLDGPISERAAQNSSNKQEVEALRLKVNELRRKAQEMGHANGLETYMQAVQAGRQADKIEYEMAQREIDLEHSLTPELVMTDMAANQTDAMIKSIETAQQELNDLAKATAQAVAAARKEIADSAALTSASLKQMTAQREGELREAYDEAAAALDKAASQIQTALRNLRGDDSHAARLVSVHIQETIGQLHWSKARGMMDLQRLLENLEKSPLGNASEAATLRKSLADSYKEEIEQAKSAFATAQEQASQVQSRNDQERIDQLNKSLESITAALEPKAAAPASPTEAPQLQITLPAGAQSSSDSSKGAESPEALVETLKSVKSIADLPRALSMNIPLRHVSGLTPASRQFAEAMNKFSVGLAAVDGALRGKFGKGIADVDDDDNEGSPMANAATVKDATLQKVEGIHGNILVTTGNGTQKNVRITQIDNRWYLGSENDAIDSSAWLLGVAGLGSTGGASADPRAQQMTQMLLQGMAQSFDKMGAIFTELADSVTRGEIASLEDFKNQSKERMKKLMEDALGQGMGGLKPPQ